MSYDMLTILELSKLCSDDNREALFSRLQEWNCIAKDMRCPREQCMAPMKLSIVRELWYCSAYYKNSSKKRVRCDKRVSVRTNTFFSQSHLTYFQILSFVRLWMRKLEVKTICEEINVRGCATGVDWNSFCREVVINECIILSKPIGGPGRVVEIDEAKFGKRKYNRGHRVEGQWVFGGIERDSNNFFLVPVEKRDRNTLLPIIKKWILPGTEIHSDYWKAYDTLSEHGYTHLKVNHSVEFKNKETDACTNMIEGLWAHAKNSLPLHGRKKDFFVGYLAKFMFCRSIKYLNVDPTEAFMRAAGRLYNNDKLDLENVPIEDLDNNNSENDDN